MVLVGLDKHSSMKLENVALCTLTSNAVEDSARSLVSLLVCMH